MADIGSVQDITMTGPSVDNITIPSVTASTVIMGVDNALNPVTQNAVRSADVMALFERSRIQLMDYLADNLR